MPKITINDKSIEVPEGSTILNAARIAGTYIPALCSHPNLKPFRTIELSDKIYQGERIIENDPDLTIESIKGCGLCVVEIEGESTLVSSCETTVEDEMIIKTDTDEIIKKRQENLIPILAKHPHSCLTCSQLEGCITLSADCSNSVPFDERCCEINGNCELQRLSAYIGIAPETPKYHHPGIPRIDDNSMFMRDYNLCIACGRCVRACQQLRGVYALGAVIHEERLIIGSLNGTILSEADCRFCGACVEVCPTGAIQDKRKPRLKDINDYVPCRANCPGDTDIPSYLRFITLGENQKSAEVIARRLSFPSTLGKVCFHPCEVECKRNDLTEAISIRAAKDFAMSNSNEVPIPEREKLTGKKVAVIGAGPAGLTAGFHLSLLGHEVTIYEKESKIGGMLRYGIPRYRLSEETLTKDLSRLLKSGINIKTNIDIGREITISSLLNNSSDAVYIATGLSKSRHLPVSMPKDDDIYYGIEFLNEVEKKKIAASIFESKEVIIIGGGNVATDAARTAVRLGADKTTIVCLEKADEMPAYQQEIDETIEEGIEILNGWGIIEILNLDKLKVELKQCTNVFDKNGNFSPKYDEATTNSISADAIIMCIGQEAVSSVINQDEKLSIFNKGLIQVKTGFTETNVDAVFAGGDIVSGPASVIDAVGAGKKAAREIDKFLGGEGVINGDEDIDYDFDAKIGKIEGFSDFERIETTLLDAKIRVKSFVPVELVYNESEACFETGRCLQCDLRMEIEQNPYPPEKYVEFSIANIEKVNNEEGVVQLLNPEKEVFLIKGSDNMKETLMDFFDDGKEASYFTFEFDPLFSKRESELMQQYLQKHGEMPDSGDDLDDLF